MINIDNLKLIGNRCTQTANQNGSQYPVLHCWICQHLFHCSTAVSEITANRRSTVLCGNSYSHLNLSCAKLYIRRSHRKFAENLLKHQLIGCKTTFVIWFYVSAAFDTVRQENVAIKKLSSPFSNILRARQAYREVKVMSIVNHRNVRTNVIVGVIRYNWIKSSFINDKKLKCSSSDCTSSERIFTATIIGQFSRYLFSHGTHGGWSQNSYRNEVNTRSFVIFVIPNALRFKAFTFCWNYT